MSKPLVVVLTLAVVSVWTSMPAVAAQGERGSLHTVRLIPPIADVEVVFRGETFRTDDRGRVRIPAVSPEAVEGSLRVPTQEVADGVRVEQNRWYPDLQLALDVYRRVSFAFTDRPGLDIDTATIPTITLKSTVGGVYRYRGAELDAEHWLHAERVTTVQAGALARPITYSVQRVMVDGTNVVNRSQQRFDPTQVQDVSIWLLFFPAEFQVRDAVFGFPIGSSIRLTFPDGRELVLPLEDGRVSVRSLPRGEYEVSADGPGLTLSVPLALSRPQDAEIMFLSYYDLAAAALVLVGFIVGLPITARTVRRRRARHTIADDEEAAVA
jgi:hypothetical protein